MTINEIASYFVSGSAIYFQEIWKKAIKKVNRDFSYGSEQDYDRIMTEAGATLTSDILKKMSSDMVRYPGKKQVKIAIKINEIVDEELLDYVIDFPTFHGP